MNLIYIVLIVASISAKPGKNQLLTCSHAQIKLASTLERNYYIEIEKLSSSYQFVFVFMTRGK